MFTTVNTTVSTAKQTASTAVQQASALGLAALLTFGMLASVNGLATAPAADSLFAGTPQLVAAAR